MRDAACVILLVYPRSILHFILLVIVTVIVIVREAPLKFMLGAFGHCPFSFCTPPPHSNGHSGALFSGPI